MTGKDTVIEFSGTSGSGPWTKLTVEEFTPPGVTAGTQPSTHTESDAVEKEPIPFPDFGSIGVVARYSQTLFAQLADFVGYTIYVRFTDYGHAAIVYTCALTECRPTGSKEDRRRLTLTFEVSGYPTIGS